MIPTNVSCVALRRTFAAAQIEQVHRAGEDAIGVRIHAGRKTDALMREVAVDVEAVVEPCCGVPAGAIGAVCEPPLEQVFALIR